MVAIGIILSLVFGVLAFGAGSGADERRNTFFVFGMAMVILSVLTAYATGAYLR